MLPEELETGVREGRKQQKQEEKRKIVAGGIETRKLVTNANTVKKTKMHKGDNLSSLLGIFKLFLNDSFYLSFSGIIIVTIVPLSGLASIVSVPLHMRLSLSLTLVSPTCTSLSSFGTG